MRRRAALALIVTVGTAAAAAGVLAPYVIAERGWRALQVRVEQAIGVRVTADGPVQGRLWPNPRVIVAGLEATAPGDPNGPPLLYADHARIDVGWQALLTGRLDSARVQVRNVRVLALPFHPPADIHGSFNPGEARFTADFEGGAGKVTLRPEADGVRLEEIEFHAGPLATAGGGRVWFGSATRAVLGLDHLRWEDDDLGRVDVAATAERDGVLVERASLRARDGGEAALFGLATVGGGEFRFSGGLDATRGDGPDALKAAARVAARLGRDSQRVDVEDVDARSGRTHLTGSARFDSGATPQTAVELRADRVDLATIDAWAALPLVPVFSSQSGELRVRAGHVSWGSASAEGVVLDVAQHDRDFKLRELAARNAGGAPLQATGAFVRGSDGTIAFRSLAFRYGHLEGRGRLAVDVQATPVKIEADLQTGPLIIDAIIPGPPPLPPEPMTRRAAAAALRQANVVRRDWSGEPLPWPTLPPVMADLHVTAPTIGWRGVRLDAATFAGRLEDGVLNVEELSGLIYGGRVHVSGRAPAPGAAPHSFAGTLRLNDLDLRQVLEAYAGIREISGRLDGTIDADAQGVSPAELIASLGGKVALNAYEGVVRGVDLGRMSAGLHEIRRPTDLFELARGGLGSGRTPFRALTGTFVLERGAATTEDLRLIAAAGEGRTRGTINLANWTLDLVNEFQLTEHPDLPPLTLKLSGPMDAPRRVFDIQRLQSSLARRGRPSNPR